mmetsp:Transcript_31576/g.72299  ORF Transcript_31576/g.72299 Transcript_31576/m.72299 type:complete len:171 (-) Transcript_31576:536-1048(-)
MPDRQKCYRFATPVRQNPRRSCGSVTSSSFSDIERLPSELHGRIFEGLPPYHRFLAPVSRKFNAAYQAHADRNDRRGSTLICGISSESQIELLDGRSISTKDCMKAANFGMLDFLKLARARGIGEDVYRFEEDICSSAAEGGHLNVLKWARAEGLTWDYRTYFNAAAGGL